MRPRGWKLAQHRISETLAEISADYDLSRLFRETRLTRRDLGLGQKNKNQHQQGTSSGGGGGASSSAMATADMFRR